MNKVFADSVYWIALINPRDQWRKAALETSRKLTDCTIYTTDEVLVETLNHFAEAGSHFRQLVSREIEQILLAREIFILDATHDNFLNGLEMFRNRPDKGYSVTDCISMLAMREHRIINVLTHDDHFTQEGFTTLL
ncbi:MAG TPA: PIN domain-containing protein [Pyrinomonadaceae bacterium]|nr:PIN domain-containing protein [Pyrinomonadaceae bacterium]HMP64322.1 PIN domain-containing protein [Pyrinomonadaceae bacterium]